jgi:hypothetical protein
MSGPEVGLGQEKRVTRDREKANGCTILHALGVKTELRAKDP